MSPNTIFISILIILFLAVFYFDFKYDMLKDISTAKRKPYSFSRVQLAWWSVIILTSFITIIATKGIPTFHQSQLVLLGISALTTGSARLIDTSDQSNNVSMIQNDERQNLLLDILSDSNGVSIHRFQSLVFNITFGIWFISEVLQKLPDSAASNIMPVLSQNDLILLGLSSGAYVALKATENKTQTAVG